MNVLVTFDISGRLIEVKAEMTKLGYYNRWTNESKTYYLPNNTLWKKNIELAAVVNELQGVIRQLNLTGSQIILERCVAVPVSPWFAIEGITAQ